MSNDGWYDEPFGSAGRYRATPATAGPWGVRSQHGQAELADIAGYVGTACQPLVIARR